MTDLDLFKAALSAHAEIDHRLGKAASADRATSAEVRASLATLATAHLEAAMTIFEASIGREKTALLLYGEADRLAIPEGAP